MRAVGTAGESEKGREVSSSISRRIVKCDSDGGEAAEGSIPW